MKKFFFSINKYILALLLGGFLSLTLPPYNFTFLSFLVFPSLLYLLFLNRDQFSEVIFKIGFLFGYGYFLTNLYWIIYSLNFDDKLVFLKPIALIVIPSLLACFYGFAFIVLKKFISNNVYFILVFSIVLSAFDFLRGIMFSGFPWNLFVYTWSWSLEHLQILRLIGTHSLNFLSILIFCLPFLFLDRFNYKKFFLNIIFIGLVLCSNYYFGKLLLINTSLSKISDLKVVILQPDQNIKDFNNENYQSIYVEQLIKLSNPKKYKNEKILFIWPEGVFANSDSLKEYRDLFSKNFSNNHLIILGATIFKKDDFYNSLLLLNNKAEILSSYNKIKLVPFGEFIPFYSFLEKINLKKVTFGYGSFSKGNNRNPISVNNEIKFLPLLCYEIIFSGTLNPEKKDYDFILNISEDGWFNKSAGTVQHLVHSQFRAIEQGKQVIRSTNQGISASIKPNGTIDQKIDFTQISSVAGDIYIQNEKTLFNIYENKIFYLLIFISSIILLFLRKKNE